MRRTIFHQVVNKFNTMGKCIDLKRNDRPKKKKKACAHDDYAIRGVISYSIMQEN